MDKPEDIGMNATIGGLSLRSLEAYEPDGSYVVEQCQCPSSCPTQDHENWRECVKAIRISKSKCRVACATKDHESWGACVKSARLGTGKGETTRGTV